jgi:tetratricopeptide repeat protein
VAEPEALLRETLPIWRNHLGNDHVYVANTLDRLADLYASEPRLLAGVQEAHGGKNQSNDERWALMLHASTRGDADAAKEAKQLTRESLAITREIFGEDHLDVARSLNALATNQRCRSECPGRSGDRFGPRPCRTRRLALRLRR